MAAQQTISISSISVENRKRPVDPATVAELKKSIEQQGLLQNIGVQETSSGYRLVFGAHRLEAVKALGWTEIQARVFPMDASDDECLLAELQENNARKELTGAERKAFAAEVGRIIAKLNENCEGENNGDSQKQGASQWIDELAKNTGTPARTIRDWWSAFTKSAGLDMTPKQAGEVEKGMFFAWLDAQKAKEDAEKAEKLAKEEAEKQRKKEEALQRRMESERADLFAYLNDTVKEWGEKVVYQWIDEWFIREINDD